ncbi:MAG: HigA family addiction module antitoxin [Alphaproteobacteria bacterium]
MSRSSTTIRKEAIPETKAFHSVHPGLVLKEELETRGLSATAFGLKLRVPPQRIQEIIAGRRAISPETALRIGRALGTGARLWLAMQQAFDLWKAEQEHGNRVRKEVETERPLGTDATRSSA